jgi:LmbE family N-acetylglucosaminyl deacetylase
MKKKLFLAPHFADLAWSCSGLLLMNISESIAVNVFSAKPENMDGWDAYPYTQEMERLSEEKFFKKFGIEYIQCDFKEALVRGRKIEEFFSLKLNEEEDKLILDLAIKIGDLIGKYRVSEIFCPKALRHHIDHYIVKKSIEKIMNPVEIYYYEDAPIFVEYKSKEKTPENLKEIKIDISSVLEEKIESVLLYPSTIKAHYKSEESVIKAIRDNPIEKYWRVIE